MSIISNEHQSGSPFDRPMTAEPPSVTGSTIYEGIGIRWHAAGAAVYVSTTLDHSTHWFALNDAQQKHPEESARYIAESFGRTLAKAFAAGRRAKSREIWSLLSEGNR